MRYEILRRCRAAVVDHEWRLVQRQFFDIHAVRRRLEGKDRTGGHAPHVRQSPCFLDECFEVFDFALHRVRLGIFAIASSPPIVVDHGEAWGEKPGQLHQFPGTGDG